jgi:hypothetical protein
MGRSADKIEIYLETGKKRTFAAAVKWPGWCRSGSNEQAALQALCDFGSRYAVIPRLAGLEFQAPAEPSAFNVIERLEGDAVTDFGAPNKSPSSDTLPVNEADLLRFQALLKACWQAFYDAAKAAEGKELRKVPRGGGRDLDRMMLHVLNAEASYLSSLGAKLKIDETNDLYQELQRTQQVILEALPAASRAGVPAVGPRGGIRWTPRYYVRRAAWHVLDHVWELEDRVI